MAATGFLLLASAALAALWAWMGGVLPADNKRVGTDTSMNAVPDADLAALAHHPAHVP